MDLEYAQQKYNEIVNVGVLRKKELFMDNNELTYYQLRRLIIKLKEKYEIHHIIKSIVIIVKKYLNLLILNYGLTIPLGNYKEI